MKLSFAKKRVLETVRFSNVVKTVGEKTISDDTFRYFYSSSMFTVLYKVPELW